MPSIENKQLINLIRYAPMVVVVIFALAVNLIAIENNQKQAAQSIQNLREELTLQRKQDVRSEVLQVYRQLLLQKSKIEDNLKDKAKQRVYEAYGIANYIYGKNIGKPKPEIAELITEALRPIRFFDDRGYFFIIDDEGNTVINVANPSIEGKSTLNIQDNYGNYTARDLLEITQNKGEGFHRWYFKKPATDDEKQFEKLGYIKKFEPYNWSIGTGDYILDAEADVKAKLLKWFSEYEYGDDGYFFVLNKSGKVLSHHANDFLGLDFMTGKTIGPALLNKFLSSTKEGGGFVSYSKPLTLSGSTSLQQYSYVKELTEWGWIIGTGFSTQAFEKQLSQKQQHFEQLNQNNLKQLIYLTIASILLLTISSLFVGNLIARRFEVFQRQINNDFNELTNTKNTMEHMALHDALTGLPNRVLMLQAIKDHIESAKIDNNKLAVMFVDLDNFKNVNDLYGHNVGDQLLTKLSQRFMKLVDDSDSVSRFGGDEFVFCFTGLDKQGQPEEKAQQIRNALLTPIVIEHNTLSIACSIGVSMYPDDGTDAETLISQADTVLYKAKADHKGQILFYNNSIREQIRRKIEIEHELRKAIKQEHLSVQYQPQISSKTQQLVSVEALARWEHEVIGTIFPDEFIAIAEETGMIHDLDMFVFRKACDDIYALSPNGPDTLKLSINISPLQLTEPDFAQNLSDICADIGIDNKRITLEVTENIFIHGLETVKPVFRALREHGFGLSLDDFGTGYSSLNYINNLPLSEIKIDRSFTSKFLNFYQTDMLVRMIISISRLCGLSIVAEGVETKEQFEKLVAYDCDLIQGYYFSRPLTIDQLYERIQNAKITTDITAIQSDDVVE